MNESKLDEAIAGVDSALKAVQVLYPPDASTQEKREALRLETTLTGLQKTLTRLRPPKLPENLKPVPRPE